MVVIDATETPIERPEKGQKRFYSGKKKRHTPEAPRLRLRSKLKLVVDPKTKAVIFTTFTTGKEHDFHRPLASTRGTRARQWTHLFKRSRVQLKKETQCLADKGYQGIQKLHANSQLPKKKRKGKQLSQLDKEMNEKLERVRGICYRIIGRQNVFKILAERYRNHRKRFGLRFNLIAGLYNYEHCLSTPD